MSASGYGQFQFAQAGPDATSSGGTLQLLTGGYVLYPIAEVLDVYDPATGNVSGKFTLAPNTVAWAANDPVEQPHYFQEKISADITYITQYTPRPASQQQAGIYYQGNNGPGLRGWVINNVATGYLGSGGTHTAPDIALQTQGIWNTALDMQAGEQTAKLTRAGRPSARADRSHLALCRRRLRRQRNQLRHRNAEHERRAADQLEGKQVYRLCGRGQRPPAGCHRCEPKPW